jgi:hypothetical protein
VEVAVEELQALASPQQAVAVVGLAQVHPRRQVHLVALAVVVVHHPQKAQEIPRQLPHHKVTMVDQAQVLVEAEVEALAKQE